MEILKMKRILIVAITLSMMFNFIGCAKKQNTAKNMEQLQKENGVPVRLSEITPRSFIQVLSYNAPLSGIEESTAKSMVSDIVLKVNAKVGDYVKKDQIIITFPEDTPSAQYEQAYSAYLNAKQTFERMQRLFDKGAISQQDMDNVSTGYAVAKANLNATSQMINVRAPISGYITAMKVNPADHVFPAAELFTVSNTSKYKAVIWVPDSEIQLVKKGMKASAVWGNQTLTGKISTTSLAMDQDKKAFKTEIVFDTRPTQIISGVILDIKIDVLNIQNAIVVDRKTIVDTGTKKYVWLEKDKKAIKTEIVTKHDNGIEYEVISGLKTGDKVIIEGISLLTENCLVQIIQ
jgi:membrane fusion protein (multidrug efflux system)